jgi:hypothetical protein
MANYNNKRCDRGRNIAMPFLILDVRVADCARPRRSECLCGDICDRKCGRGGIAVKKIPNCDAEWQATLSRISDFKFFNYGNIKKNRPHS